MLALRTAEPDTLIVLARRDEYGPVELEKLALAEALAAMLVRELEDAGGDPEALERIKEQRPLIKFVLERLEPAINRARPAGHD